MPNQRKVFDTSKSIAKARTMRDSSPKWKLVYGEKEYSWNSKMERVNLIRRGIPYGSVEVISKRINSPVKDILHIVGIPQTTYNKKKNENSLLSGRDSELILLLTELTDFGVEVFNDEEEKFQRWLKKPNLSLGGSTPESLLDTTTGIQEVRNALNRIEYGNLA
jgi:putative toxin-antitoxin system antitoxin component (TIGR02293 family)